MAASAGLPPLGLNRGASSSVPQSDERAPLCPHQPHPSHSSAGCVMVETVDDAEGLYVAVERCPLCSTSRRRLTCSRCVQAGDFVYFNGRNTERLGSCHESCPLRLVVVVVSLSGSNLKSVQPFYFQ